MRNLRKRFTAALCAVVMAAALLPGQVWAEEEPALYAESCGGNPLSAADISPENPLFFGTASYALLSEDDAPDANSEEVPSFSTSEAAADYIRSALKKHTEELTLLYTDIPETGPFIELSDEEANAPYTDEELEAAAEWGYTSESEAQRNFILSNRRFNKYLTQLLVGQIFPVVFQHNSADPTGGDYLTYNVYAWYAGASYEYGQLAISFVFVYYADAAQEEATAKAAEDIISTLNLTGKSDYEKVKAIYGWLCAYVDYDFENLDDDTYLLKHSTYAALVQRKAVCQGYATAFYRLALMAGLDARFISGYGLVEDETGNSYWGEHGWNIVRLDGRWYYLDATWDAGYSEEEAEEWNYFLRASLMYHKLDHDGEAVVELYNISPTDYDPNAVRKGSGNLNGDDKLDITDVQLLYTFLLTGETPTGASMQEANVNGDKDGVIDVYDLQLLYEMVNGLV